MALRLAERHTPTVPIGSPEMALERARRLQKAREDAGIKQEVLAERLSISNVSVSRYENGKRQPPLDYLAAFRELTGASLDALVDHRSLTSGVKPDDENRRGESKPEGSIMDRLNDDAVTLGIQFMRVPEEERDAVFNEALALFRRRARPRPPRGEDHAEGDL